MQKEVSIEFILRLAHIFRSFYFFLLFMMQGEEVDYRGVLHRDGSVLMSVSLDKLKVSSGFVSSPLISIACCISPYHNFVQIESQCLRVVFNCEISCNTGMCPQ